MKKLTSMPKIVLPRRTPVYHALDTVLRALSANAAKQIAFADQLDTNADEAVPFIGMVVAWDGKAFLAEFNALSNFRLSACIVYCPVKWERLPWSDFISDDRAAFEKTVEPYICGSVSELIDALERATAQATSGLASSTAPSSSGQFDGAGVLCQQAVAIKACYEDLQGLLHGSAQDVVNTLYAPARMLAIASQSKTGNAQVACDQLVSSMDKSVRYKIDKLPAQIGAQINLFPWPGSNPDPRQALKDAVETVHAVLFPSPPASVKVTNIPVDQIERIMEGFSELRRRAGAAVLAGDYAAGETPNPLFFKKIIAESAPPIDDETSKWDDKDCYRILVIDDHAASWSPALQLVGKTLVLDPELNSRAIRIDFATSITPDARRMIPECDLILLDIYLPGASGIDLLKQIRMSLGHVPVILWTTSIDKELPASASMASGFLFKKTATVDSIAEAIGNWLATGRSRRKWCLLNPLFDHALHDSKERSLALDFTNWCLKYLDSFHAVDPLIFRFFNDHGGRHIWGILSILQKLTLPFLLEDDDGSEMALAREDLLLLYLSALCHELGMFPREIEGNFENCCRSAIKAVRKLHSIRSMLLVQQGGKWGGSYYAELDGLLERLGEVRRNSLAILVGHHQKTLTAHVNSDINPFDFAEQSKLIEAAELHKKPSCKLAKTIIADYAQTSADLNLFVTPGEEKGQSDVLIKRRNTRLCQLSALLRFADALDMDYTRIPADFLLTHSDRNIYDDIENFKRQILREVRIEQGEITLVFGWPQDQPDDLTLLDKVNWFAAYKEHTFDREGVNDRTSRIWQEAWASLTGREAPAAPSIDDWLFAFFQRPREERDVNSRKLCMVATALAVCGEITEEYAAIEAAGLDGRISLGSVVWLLMPEATFSLLDTTPAQVSRDHQCSYCHWCSDSMNMEDEREIERKFLITALPPGLDHFRSIAIRQGYLPIAQDKNEIRVRAEDARHFLTVKSDGALSRTHREVAISQIHFDAIWPLTEGRRITKRRYLLPCEKLTIELDVYEYDHEGLVTAEVEFPSEDASRAFTPLEWFGTDVTHAVEYKNKNLAVNGIPLQ